MRHLYVVCPILPRYPVLKPLVFLVECDAALAFNFQQQGAALVAGNNIREYPLLIPPFQHWRTACVDSVGANNPTPLLFTPSNHKLLHFTSEAPCLTILQLQHPM